MNSTEKHVEELRRNRDYVSEDKFALKAIYGDNYIAVYNNRVIDFDINRFELARRIGERYREKTVLISTIDDCINPKKSNLEFPETD